MVGRSADERNGRVGVGHLHLIDGEQQVAGLQLATGERDASHRLEDGRRACVLLAAVLLTRSTPTGASLVGLVGWTTTMLALIFCWRHTPSLRRLVLIGCTHASVRVFV